MALSPDHVELLRDRPNFNIEDYSLQLKSALSKTDVIERALSLRDLYREYEEITCGLSMECSMDLINGVKTSESEERVLLLKTYHAEMTVLRKNIESLLEPYKDVRFPTNRPVDMLSYLLRKGLLKQQ